MVAGPQTSNVENSGTVDSYGNSVYTDPPVSAYPSSNTVYPQGQTSSPCLGVQQVQYHDVPVSIVAVTDHPPVHNTSLDTEFFRCVPDILL